MTVVFWIFAALMLVVALFFCLLPVFRYHKNKLHDLRNSMNIHIHQENLDELEEEFRNGAIDHNEFESARQEIQFGLVNDIIDGVSENDYDITQRPFKTILTIMLVFPVAIITAYLVLGDINMVAHTPKQDNQEALVNDAHSVEDMVTNLSTRLEQQPEDIEGWKMLARSYLVMDRHLDAVYAYRNARKYAGNDPGILADLSEALILANNNQLTDEVEDLIRLSLQANPDEPKALWIAGYGNYELGNLTKTLEFWERLLNVLQPGSSEYNTLNENIKQIRQHVAFANNNSNTSQFTANTEEQSSSLNTTRQADQQYSSVDVHVSIDKKLMEQLEPDDTVFIFARAKDGPRMPLAIARKKAKDLPLRVTLDDSMSMSPGMTLSAFDEIIIGARVSKSGQALPSSGDFSGTTETIATKEVTGVKVTINEVIP